jgi:hypothetical protein
MQAASEANDKPRVLIRISRGLVSIHSCSELELTVVDDDLEVRCDNVFHSCSADELDELIRRTSYYRFDPFIAQSLAGDE